MRVAGNQLPELLIFFEIEWATHEERWESVTRTLDILSATPHRKPDELGISYQNS